MKETFQTLIILLLLCSCEPNRVQKADKRRHEIDDSIMAAITAQSRILDLEIKKKDSLTHLKRELINVKAKLEVENDKMNRIKQVQSGRTIALREQQIANESKYIQQLSDEETNLQSKISSLQK